MMKLVWVVSVKNQRVMCDRSETHGKISKHMSGVHLRLFTLGFAPKITLKTFQSLKDGDASQ